MARTRRDEGDGGNGANGSGDEPAFGGIVDRDALNRYVSRIEAIETERSGLSDDVKAIYAEAKSAGFQVPILRQIVRERRMEESERHDHYAILDAYRGALGMLAGTPLGDAAMERSAAEESASAGSGRRRRRANGDAAGEDATA